MKTRLPAEFDPHKMAVEGRAGSASLPLINMKRLGESVLNLAGEAQVSLSGDVDRSRNKLIRGHVTANLSLECQRCVQEMILSVDRSFTLVLVSEDAEEALSEEFEPLLCDGSMLLTADVVEDELILALPLIPRHEYDCGFKPAETRQETKPVETAETQKPFAGLADLIKTQQAGSKD